MNGRDLRTTIGSRTDPLCYLATPFTKFPAGPVLAFEHAAALAADLLVAGIKCYSPIAHTFPLAQYGNLDPLDHSIWLPFDEAMMNVCDVLIVAHMPGWEESFGIAHEIAFFIRAGKPIFDLDPVTMMMTKWKVEVIPPNGRQPQLSPESKSFA